MATVSDKMVFFYCFLSQCNEQMTNSMITTDIKLNVEFRFDCETSMYMTVITLPRHIKHNIIHITIGFMRFKSKCHNNKTKCALKENEKRKIKNITEDI